MSLFIRLHFMRAWAAGKPCIDRELTLNCLKRLRCPDGKLLSTPLQGNLLTAGSCCNCGFVLRVGLGYNLPDEGQRAKPQ